MSQPKVSAPDPGEIAGRYQVVQKLGAGAFGTVYKAKDRILGRMVAIKTIRLEGLAAASTDLRELTDRFKREAQVSAQLRHPNIVTIYDIGEAEGASYLAMEFIDGVGLDKVIAAGPLPVERAAVIGAQVADALDFAHRASVVHRDIKPANIMVEAGDRVKVTDFGIAKVTNSAEHLTMTGSLLGTPSYMSPEQARGASIDGRSDLFAVGCVLYEMAAGRKAFSGDSITGLIFKIITEEPPPLEETGREVPEAFARIVKRALAKAPETRYQNGRELADDLLALTRAGSSPTLRQSETPTASGMPATGAATVISSPAAAPATFVAPKRAAQEVASSSPSSVTTGAAQPAARTIPVTPATRPAPRKHSSAGLLVSVSGAARLDAFGRLIRENMVAVNHDHFLSYRLDLDVDGPLNSFAVDRLAPQRLPAASPRKSLWTVESQTLRSELDGRLHMSMERPSLWRVINPARKGPTGYPVSYQVKPGHTAMSLLAPEDNPQLRGGFSSHSLWVTRQDDQQRLASGPYPTGAKRAGGLPVWAEANRPIENADIVVWYTMGMHHVVRAEDWPIMPVAWHELELRPFDFFARNPALDLPR